MRGSSRTCPPPPNEPGHATGAEGAFLCTMTPPPPHSGARRPVAAAGGVLQRLRRVSLPHAPCAAPVRAGGLRPQDSAFWAFLRRPAGGPAPAAQAPSRTASPQHRAPCSLEPPPLTPPYSNQVTPILRSPPASDGSRRDEAPAPAQDVTRPAAGGDVPGGPRAGRRRAAVSPPRRARRASPSVRCR